MQTDILRIPLSKPYFNREMEEAAIHALRNEKYVLGESVFKFEEEFARYCGTDYAVSTSSGTNALQIALIAMGMNSRFQVLTPAMSFIASANSSLHAGGEPTFVDIDPDKYNIDVRSLEASLTEKCQAIMAVHLYGRPADMDEVMEIATRRGLKVIEDAAQAHGAQYRQQKVGSIGDAGCFSFYPTKNMTVCGDGGMITTNDTKIAKISAKVRDCGRASHYVHDCIGYTSRLNTVSAAIGRVQLRHLDEWVRKRQQLAEKYHSLLKDVNEIQLPLQPTSNVKPSYHLYVIQAQRRDELKNWLESAGIQSGVHYPEAIPFQPIYREMYAFQRGSFPAAEEFAKKTLSLPTYPDLATSHVTHICDKIVEFYNQQSSRLHQ